MSQNPLIIFQFLLTLNFRGLFRKRVISQNIKENAVQIVLSDGRPISNTMKLAIKHFAVFFYARQDFSRAVSLSNTVIRA